METDTLQEDKKIVETGCCPPLDPTLWDDKILTWDKKLFIRDKVMTFYYMPMTFGKVMTRLNKKVVEAGADLPHWLCLSDHTSKWNMDVYLEVDKEIPGMENLTFSGKYYSKVYEGPFKDTGKWSEDFEKTTREKGITTKKCYMWYTTCPKCAKAYGKNYTVFIAEVA